MDIDVAGTINARASFGGFFAHVAATSKGAMTENVITRIWDVFYPWLFSQRGKIHGSIVAPAGLYKSEKVRYFSCYALGTDPTLRIVYTSRDLNVSTSSVASCRKIVTSLKYQSVFPEVMPDKIETKHASHHRTLTEERMGWQAGKFFLKHRGTFDPHPAMEAVAADPDAQNRRVDLLIADDFETKATARSAMIRKHVYSTFMETWLRGRLMSGDSQGQAIAIQNCWHKEDLAHQLRRDSRFVSVWLGVSESMDSLFIRLYNAPEDCELIQQSRRLGMVRCPAEDGGSHQYEVPLPDGSERFNVEALHAEKRSNVFFASTYRLRASDDSDRMLPSWPKRRVHPGRVHEMMSAIEENGRPVFGPVHRSQYSFAWGYDMSSARRQKPGDCLFLLSIDSRGVYRPIEVHYGQFNAAQVVALVNDAYNRGVHPSTFRIEDNATQDKFLREVKIVAETEKVNWASAIEAHSTGQNKHDAAMGVPSLDLEITDGKLEWPEGESLPGAPFRNHWQRFAQELEECPRYPERGQTPEAPMALWFAVKGLRERACLASRNQPVKSIAQAGRNRINF